MDPDVTLQEIREDVSALLDGGAPERVDVSQLAERVRALDEWLTRGGFVPSQWGGPL